MGRTHTLPRAGTLPRHPLPPPHLLELVHQLFGVHLHGGERVLVLSQLEHLDGHLAAGEHGAHLLLLVRGVLARLRRARSGIGTWWSPAWHPHPIPPGETESPAPYRVRGTTSVPSHVGAVTPSPPRHPRCTGCSAARSSPAATAPAPASAGSAAPPRSAPPASPAR